MSETLIEPATVQAYRETEYRVEGDDPFTLRIDEPSDPLRALHKRRSVKASAFLTAWNPYSQETDAAINRIRQQELVLEIRGRGLSSVRGIGQHPSNGWAGEESLLALGLDLEAAKTVGRRFEQNAIVWCGADAVPRLILLR